MDETLKRKAYLEGLKLKNSGLDQEIIYARLEKQGIPEELAKEVAKNVMLERQIVQEKETEEKINKSLVIAGIGVFLAILSLIIFPDRIIIPAGMIVGGIVTAIITNNNRNR